MTYPTRGDRLPLLPPETSDVNSRLLCTPDGLISVPGRKLSPALRPTKLLLKVTIQSSLGPVHLVISSENTVRDLMKAAIEIYVKEKRRPLLNETDPCCFQLHYSQFSLESLNPEEKLMNLGSRNFFLCRRPSNAANSSSTDELKEAVNSLFPSIKLMDFLL